MKKLLLLLILFVSVPFVCAQDPQPKYVAGGIGISREVPGSVLGWGALAVPLQEKVYSYTSADVFLVDSTVDTPWSIAGHKFQLTARTSLAYRLFQYKRLTLWGLGGFGITTVGNSVTSSTAGGGFLHYKINDVAGAMIILQADRSPLTGTDFKPRFGLTFNLSKLFQGP